MLRRVSSIVHRVGKKLGVYRELNRARFRHEADAAFIWVPKSAGTSLWHAIAGQTRPILLTPEDVRAQFPQCGMVTFGHQSYLQLVEEGYVSREFDRRAFKFTFVRNPFDRMVSLYHYLKKTRDLHANTSFRTFCYLVRDRSFDSIGLFNHRGLSQCSPQSEWLVDRQGELFVDFVGRFENLHEDFAKICQRLQITAQLPHLNQTEREDYTRYYDDECLEIVSEIYRADCERFGYSFHQSDSLAAEAAPCEESR